jgi:hypothetical protein
MPSTPNSDDTISPQEERWTRIKPADVHRDFDQERAIVLSPQGA